MITLIYVTIDNIIRTINPDPKPGPKGKLNESEVLTIMVIYPLLKPFCDLKRFYNWLTWNFRDMFPELPEYSRITRLFKDHKELMVVVMKAFADLNSFGLVADGTCVGVMETIRGKYAKSFRDARKVKCASKNEWHWGFILEAIIDKNGAIAFANIGTEAEVRQLEEILEDLQDRWVSGDRGNRGKELHKRLWDDKQIKIKITGGKERQWIENVFGFLKEKLGLNKIRVRKTPAFLARVFSILCCYNLILKLDLPI